jgi:hypothetical protein
MQTDIESSNPYASPIQPVSDNARVKHGRRAVSPPTRVLRFFQLLAAYALALGLVGLPIGLFVGPHLLFAAFGHLLVGVIAVGVNYGLHHAAALGWWAGVALSTTIAIVSAVAVLEALPADGGIPACVFFSISGILFTAVLVDLVRSRPHI